MVTTREVRPLPRECRYCAAGLDYIERVKQRTASGSIQILDECTKCGRNTTIDGPFIPHAIAGNIDNFPLVADNTREMPACERCGAHVGVELHHWSPQHIFEDAHRWPMSYLCQWCHQEWHQIMGEHTNDNCSYCKRYQKQSA